MAKKKALIIGGGIAGPALAMFLQCVGIDSVIYEAESGPNNGGAFVNVSSNGLDVLRTLGIVDEVVAMASPSTAMAMWNSRGKRIATFDYGINDVHTVASITIKRSVLNKALRDEALHRGIQIEYGKKLIGIETVGDQVTAVFADGTRATGDLVIGCDGIHSRTRESLFPDSPKPRYTGTIGCGGFARNPVIPSSNSVFNLVRGKYAFFGYQVMDSDEIFWFDHMQWPQEPKRGELNAVSRSEWHQKLMALHGDDPAPVPQILQSLTSDIGTYAIYDMPYLETWHKGRVCLIGDAAHATSPHAGQGVSLALEDAIVLAKCLRDLPNVEQAFTTFQSQRMERVQKIIQLARRRGQGHFSSSPFNEWLQDVMTAIFSKLFAHGDDWMYAYRVDWDEVVPVVPTGRSHSTSRSKDDVTASLQHNN